MRAFKKKPCPGCGNEFAIAPGTVCGNCAAAIREYPKTKAALASADTRELRECLLGERSGIPSKLYSFNSSHELATAISGLLRCVGHATENVDTPTFQNCHPVPYRNFGVLECVHRDIERQDWRVHLPREIGDHLAALFTAIESVALEANERGQERGQNLLFQLNSGVLSLAQFNDSAINGVK